MSALEVEDAISSDLARATGLAEAAEESSKRLNRVLQLTGFSDPVYAEAYVTVHQYDIVLDVTVLNRCGAFARRGVGRAQSNRPTRGRAQSHRPTRQARRPLARAPCRGAAPAHALPCRTSSRPQPPPPPGRPTRCRT
jgi:hypothetical protein